MITSSRNPRIQQVRALLARRSEREERGEFVLEGVRLVEEALQSGWQARLALYTAQLSERGTALLPRFGAQGAETEEVPPHLLEQLSDTGTPPGLLAVFARQELPYPPQPDFVLVADGLHDPGNLGTLLRSAAAAGAQAVLLTPGTADPFAPKVLRAAMGAHFRLPIRQPGWEALPALLKPGLRVFAAEAGGGKPCWQADLTQPLALLIGGEAEGIQPQARALADEAVTIPMPGQSESLNAAVASGILLFEVVRQRRLL